MTACHGIHTHTRLTALCPGLPRWAGTRKVKPIWILLMQETVSGSGISCAIYKSASRSRQITMPAPHHSVFYRPDALPAAQPTASKHWRDLSWHSACKTVLVVLQMKCIQCFDTVGWSSGRASGLQSWVVRCWCGYLSAARCRLFACGPADATASRNPIIFCLI